VPHPIAPRQSSGGREAARVGAHPVVVDHGVVLEAVELERAEHVEAQLTQHALQAALGVSMQD